MRRSSYGVPLVLTGILAIVAAVVGLSRPAISATEGKPPTWEHRLHTVSIGDLPAKVVELGNEGWEIQSLTPYETILEPTADSSKPHLLVEKYIVITRRPAN